jgi:hypothetical protein
MTEDEGSTTVIRGTLHCPPIVRQGPLPKLFLGVEKRPFEVCIMPRPVWELDAEFQDRSRQSSTAKQHRFPFQSNLWSTPNQRDHSSGPPGNPSRDKLSRSWGESLRQGALDSLAQLETVPLPRQPAPQDCAGHCLNHRTARCIEVSFLIRSDLFIVIASH